MAAVRRRPYHVVYYVNWRTIHPAPRSTISDPPRATIHDPPNAMIHNPRSTQRHGPPSTIHPVPRDTIHDPRRTQRHDPRSTMENAGAPETYQNDVLKGLRTFYKVLGGFRRFWEALEGFRRFWKGFGKDFGSFGPLVLPSLLHIRIPIVNQNQCFGNFLLLWKLRSHRVPRVSSSFCILSYIYSRIPVINQNQSQIPPDPP